MMAEILAGLARANLAMAVAIIVVLALRAPIRRWAGAGAAYGLWSAVPIAAAAALAPAVASPPRSGFVTDAVVAHIAPAAFEAHPSWTAVLFAGWTLGAAVALGVLALRQARFVASLGRLDQTSDGVRLRAERRGVGPVVIGALRPRIITPADFEERFAPNERALILAHEAMHLARADTLVNAVAAAARCVCWFNPFVHAAVRRLGIDQELACDAAVLSRFPDERRRYGEVLLKTQLSTQSVPLGLQWPGGADHPLKERIAMLKSPPPSARRRGLGVSVVAAVALSIGYAALAAAPTADFSGAWSLKGEITSGEHLVKATPTCTFTQSGETLTGACEGPNSRGPAMGKVSGQRVSWRWDFKGFTKAGQSGSGDFHGTLGKDGGVHGVWTYSGLPGASGPFIGQHKG